MIELKLNAPYTDKNYSNNLRWYAFNNGHDAYWDFHVSDISNSLWIDTYDGGFGFFDYESGLYLTSPNPRSFNQSKPNDMSPVLDKVKKLKPQTFTGTGNHHTQHVFIAQELMKIFPETVYSTKSRSREGLVYGINYDEFSVIAIKAIQEQQQQIAETKNENDKLLTTIEELQTKNYELEQRLSRLEENMIKQSSTQLQQGATINVSPASLEQNIPNPFRHTTTINYTLPPKFSQAYILITDQHGKTIRKVEATGSGKSFLQVDASSLSSGTYRYSLYVDGKVVDTKQMITVK